MTAAHDDAPDTALSRPPAPGTRRPVAAALQYTPGQDDAPRVTASGHGHVAEQIVQLALASGVKVREDADLAQVLAAVQLDTPIPNEAFVAVAEVLSYVYRANAAAWQRAATAPPASAASHGATTEDSP